MAAGARSCGLVVVTLLLVACSGGATSTGDGVPSGTGAGAGSGAGTGTGAASGSGATGSGTGSGTGTGTGASGGVASAPLSPLEQSMVGVWVGNATSTTVDYYVLVGDRTGCLWERDGDDYGQRFSEIQFSNWHLEEGALDADSRMTLSFTNRKDGSPQAIERYDPKTDKLMFAGLTPMTWQKFLMDCAAKGTQSTQTNVARGGVLGK